MDEKPVPVQAPKGQASLNWHSLPRDISTSRYWSECPQVEPKQVPWIDQSHPQNSNLVMFQGKKCWFTAVHAIVPDRGYVRETDTPTVLHESKKLAYAVEYEVHD
jgi:hypothetical protein